MICFEGTYVVCLWVLCCDMFLKEHRLCLCVCWVRYFEETYLLCLRVCWVRCLEETDILCLLGNMFWRNICLVFVCWESECGDGHAWCSGMTRQGWGCRNWIVKWWLEVAVPAGYGARELAARAWTKYGLPVHTIHGPSLPRYYATGVIRGLETWGLNEWTSLEELNKWGMKLKSITLINQEILIYGTVQGRAILGYD